MKDIIIVNVGKDHIFETETKVIGREGESLTSCFKIALAEELRNCWAYLDFEKANGEKFKSKKLDIVDGIIEYDIPASVLTEDGELGVQLVLQREDGLIWKTYDKKFLNRKSIDAVDDIPNKEDFVAEMQEAIDKVYDIEEKVDNIDPRLLELNLENVATKEYVDGLVSGKLKRAFVDGELGDPADFDTNTIYMLQSKNSSENNIYEEYMVIDGKWELIGSTAVDLSGYATKEELEAKADKEANYEVVYETTLTEARQSIVIDNLNLKKARIYIEAPASTGTSNLYVRLNKTDVNSAKQVAFCSSFLKTSAQLTKIDVEKANGEINAKWWVTGADNKLASTYEYAFEDYAYVTSQNIQIIHLLGTSSTHILPVGTTIKVKGVQA